MSGPKATCPTCGRTGLTLVGPNQTIPSHNPGVPTGWRVSDPTDRRGRCTGTGRSRFEFQSTDPEPRP